MVTDTQPQVPISLALAQTALLLLCLRSFLSLAINTRVCPERRYRSANLVLLHQWPSHLKIAGALFHLQKTPISWETQLLPSKAVLYLIIWTKTSILKKKKHQEYLKGPQIKWKKEKICNILKSPFLRKSYGLGPQWTIFACLSLILSQSQKWNPKNPQKINKPIDADLWLLPNVLLQLVDRYPAIHSLGANYSLHM